jgi:hypothetical protein
VFLDPVNRGAVQGTFYPDLIIREIPVAQPQAIVPKIDLSDAALVDSNEAATIEEGTITYGTKTVSIAKKAKAIKITDEASCSRRSPCCRSSWRISAGCSATR